MKKKALVLIHGFPFDSSMWDEQKAFLKNFCDVHAPDLPGFGESKISACSSIEDFAKFIKQYVEEEKLGRVILCGFSMGGYIAFAFYEMFPQFVEALIFADTRAKDDSPEGKKGRDLAIRNAEICGTDFFVENMPEKLLSKENLENDLILSKVKSIISKQKKESIINALIAMRERKDRSFLLQKIDIPSLFICGEKDILSTPEEMREMSEAVKNSRFEIVKDAGHLSNIENSSQFNTILLDFLK